MTRPATLPTTSGGTTSSSSPALPAPQPASNLQVADLAATLSDSLASVGAAWDNVISASFFLRRDQDLANLRSLWNSVVSAPVPYSQTTLVDGFAGEGNLLEIEITAQV